MRTLTLITCLLATAGAATAQVGASNPGIAAQRSISESRLERAVTRPVTPAGPALTSPGATVARPSPEADAQTLAVKSIAFTGNTALSRAELDALARPYVGRSVSFRELQTLALKVELKYRQLGFVAARVLVPQQKVVDGQITIAVFEGRYGQIRVEGEKHYSEKFIRRFFHFARPGELVRQDELLQTLLVLREMPNLGIRSALVAGAKPGTSDLVLVVNEARPFHVDYEYNNFGIRLVGRNRAAIGVSGSDAFTDGDELVLRYTELFPSNSDPIYQAGYNVPIFDAGGRLGVNYLKSRTRVGGAFEALDLRGNVEVASLSYQHPLTRTLRKSESASLSLSTKTVESFVFGDTLTSRDDLRVLAGTYSLVQSFRMARAITQATLSTGLGTFANGRGRDNPIASRVGAGNDFVKFNLDHVHYFQLDRQNAILARFSGQLADVQLTVAELFSLGGADSVRGFVQSELLGDEGYFASAEFRHRWVDKNSFKLDVTAFVDDGHVTLLAPQPGEDGSQHRTGAGFGFRTQMGTWGTTRLELGFPISKARSAEGDNALLYAQHTARF